MAITQTIATLPAVLNDSATFYEDIAIRNNSLVTVSFPSINAWATQANNTQTEINAKASEASASATSAATSATTATTKASEASANATSALGYKNDVSAMKVAVETIYDTFEARFSVIDTVDNFGTVPSGIDTVIVKDNNRGGTFIYDATQSAVNNGGTVFDGWCRQYSGGLHPEWFGAVGDIDHAPTMQICLDYATTIGKEMLITKPMNQKSTIEVKDGATIRYNGGKTIASELVSIYNVRYGGKLIDIVIDANNVLLDTTVLINVIPWESTSLLGSSPIITGVIYGNDPLNSSPAINLQGTGVQIDLTCTASKPILCVQYAKIDLDVWGLRDPLVINVNQNLLTDIVYVNACQIKIRSLKCLRPVQLNNSAALAQILSGNAQIADNDITVYAQHHTDSYPIIQANGCNANRFDGSAEDWAYTHVNFTATSVSNTVLDCGLVKINDSNGLNRVVRDMTVNASAVYDGYSNVLRFTTGGVSVTKSDIGVYLFTWSKPFKTNDSYVVSVLASPSSESVTIPFQISITEGRTTTSCVIKINRTDTGAQQDLNQINFSVVGILS